MLDEVRQRRRTQVQSLIGLITATIEPDTWAVNGGRGTIVPYGDGLLIRNSMFVHEKLAAGERGAKSESRRSRPAGRGDGPNSGSTVP